jgi:hypothetical protein
MKSNVVECILCTASYTAKGLVGNLKPEPNVITFNLNDEAFKASLHRASGEFTLTDQI